MMMLSQKPENLSLIEYFNTLNVFDKRELINNLRAFKSISDKSLRYFNYLLAFSVLSSVICIAILPNILVVSTYTLLSLGVFVIFYKKYKISIKYKTVIEYLQKNM
jgi:uncharacterized membrane protein